MLAATGLASGQAVCENHLPITGGVRHQYAGTFWWEERDGARVKGKTRLNVLVMFTPQFYSFRPHSFNPKCVWKYHGLLLGFDPVAVDATGLRIIEAIRRECFGDDRPLNPPAKHIAIADTKYHLGTADPKKIDLVKIGINTDSFV